MSLQPGTTPWYILCILAFVCFAVFFGAFIGFFFVTFVLWQLGIPYEVDTVAAHTGAVFGVATAIITTVIAFRDHRQVVRRKNGGVSRNPRKFRQPSWIGPNPLSP